jgi:hypothetical protein
MVSNGVLPGLTAYWAPQVSQPVLNVYNLNGHSDVHQMRSQGCPHICRQPMSPDTKSSACTVTLQVQSPIETYKKHAYTLAFISCVLQVVAFVVMDIYLVRLDDMITTLAAIGERKHACVHSFRETWDPCLLQHQTQSSVVTTHNMECAGEAGSTAAHISVVAHTLYQSYAGLTAPHLVGMSGPEVIPSVTQDLWSAVLRFRRAHEDVYAGAGASSGSGQGLPAEFGFKSIWGESSG